MNPFADLINTGGQQGQGGVPDYSQLFTEFRKQPVQQKKKKNFWLDQISTAGGILGGIGGSFIAPIAGTAGGAAAGSALGEAIEKMIDPNSTDWGNVAQEGIIGGIMGAGPIKLLKGAGAGAKALATGSDDVLGVASKAARTSMLNRGARLAPPTAIVGANTTTEPAQQVLKTSITGKINALGDKALMSQYGTIGKNVANQTSPSTTIKQLADIGITRPVDAERIGSAITGSNGLLTRTVAEAAGNAKPVKVTGMNKVIRDAITENGVVDKDAKSVINTINAQLKTISQDGGSPSTVLKTMRGLESRIANLQGKGGNYRLSTPERIDQANVLKAVRDELEDRLYRVSGANKNIASVLTPELRESLVKLNPGNNQWQSYIDDVVMKSKDVGSLRAAQAPFVRVGKIIQEGADNAMTFGGRATGMGGGSLGSRFLDASTEVLKNPIMRGVSKPLRGVGQPIVNAGRGNQGVLGGLGIAGRVGLTGLPEDSEDQSMGPNIMNQQYNANPMTSDTTMMPANSSNMMGQEYQTQQDLSSPFAPQNVQANVGSILQQGGDFKDVKEYLSLVDAITKIQGAGNASPYGDLSQSSRNSLASADNAINTVSQLEQLFTNAGSGSGRIGGSIKGLAARAGFDEDAKIYDSLANASVTQIAKALAGSGAGTVSDMDAKVIMAALPTLRDTPAEARAKFAALKQRLDTAKQNSMVYGGGSGQPESSSLEDAMLQYSYQ